MTKRQIFIVGAGGHSKVASEIIASQDEWEIVGYLDENPKAASFLGKIVVQTISDLQSKFPDARHAFVAIGNNQSRRHWYKILQDNDCAIPWFKHKSAEVSISACIKPGTLIAAKAIVGADSSIGEAVIINTGAIVDHDTSIGDFSHLSQGSIICGGAQVGSDALIGPGCIVEKMTEVPSLASIPSNTVFAAVQQQRAPYGNL